MHVANCLYIYSLGCTSNQIMCIIIIEKLSFVEIFIG